MTLYCKSRHPEYPIDKCISVCKKDNTSWGASEQIFSKSRKPTVIEECSTCLLASGHASGVITKDGIRKLTPLECRRLQGFPDDYTDGIPERSDIKEYSLWGNGISLPIAKFILKGIKNDPV